MKTIAVLTFILFSLTGSFAEAQQYQGKIFCGGTTGYAGGIKTLLSTTITIIDPNYRTISTIAPFLEAAKAMVNRDCLSQDPMNRMGDIRVLVDTPSGRRALVLDWEVKTGVFKVTSDTRVDAARFDAGERPKNCGSCTYNDMDCRSSCPLLDQTCRKTCDMKKDLCTKQNCSN
jgi:hypothetical protein